MKIFQQYDQIKVEDVGSSSETESESESEAIVPSGMLPFCPKWPIRMLPLHGYGNINGRMVTWKSKKYEE